MIIDRMVSTYYTYILLKLVKILVKFHILSLVRFWTKNVVFFPTLFTHLKTGMLKGKKDKYTQSGWIYLGMSLKFVTRALCLALISFILRFLLHPYLYIFQSRFALSILLLKNSTCYMFFTV